MGNKLSYSPLYDTLQQLKSEIFKGLRVCVPGSIAAVNSDGTVNVQVGLMQNVTQQNTPLGLPVTYPLLTMCPVFTLQGGGIGAVMPIKKNDECIVVFSDRCIENWFSTGQPNPLPSLRMHDISDGFVFVGLNSMANPLLTPLNANEGGICDTKNALGAKVAVNSTTHKITIANATQDLATILGNLVIALGVLNTAIAGESATIPAAASAAAANTAAITAVTVALNALLY